MRAIVLVLVVSLWSVGIDAADIQYVLATGDVTNIPNGPVSPVAGYGVVTIAEPAEAIQWPVPAGCSAGQPQWTRITDPLLVTAGGAGMEVQPELVGFFFASTSPLLTGCHLVLNLSALRRLVRDTIAVATSDLTTIQGFGPYQDWYDMQCRGAESNANCVATRANLDTMRTFVPGRGQMETQTGHGATLSSDAQAFKTLKGW